MWIPNYNSAAHDIYVFGITTESKEFLTNNNLLFYPYPGNTAGTVGLNYIPAGTSYSYLLCAVPGSITETIPGIRRHAPVKRYNTDGLWSGYTGAGGAPDWSGLSVRGRGSPLYLGEGVFKGFKVNGNTGSYDELHNHMNWNNGLPPFIVISNKHMLGVKHFVGNTGPVDVKFLGTNNKIYTIAGTYIDTYNDANLYGISLNAEQSPYIKAYDILDLQQPNDWTNTRIWWQHNQGTFISGLIGISYINNTDIYSSVTGPDNFPTFDFNVWPGDSGTPILATHNNETYFVGNFAGVFYGSISGINDTESERNGWTWLSNHLATDGIIKNLITNLQEPIYRKTPLSISPYDSRFTTDIDVKIHSNEQDYGNMTFIGFYGGTSLQSQELNELQETIQNQLSLANKFTASWLKYLPDTLFSERGTTGGFVSVDDNIVPLEPHYIKSNRLIINGWYMVKDTTGYKYFVVLPGTTWDVDQTYTQYLTTNLQRRIVEGSDSKWTMLNIEDAYENTGADRIQQYLL